MSNPPAPTDHGSLPEASAADIERLRDILFGAQARSTDRRLGDVEIRLETTRRELTSLLEEKVGALGDTAAEQLAEARKQLSDRLDGQDASQTTQLRAAHKELSDLINRQAADQAAQLRAVHKELSDQIEKLTADLFHQIRATHKELSDRLDRVNAEQSERSRQLQAEARQRDDALRQEVLTLAATLNDKKTSRHDLGQMLVEVGLRLRGGGDAKV